MKKVLAMAAIIFLTAFSTQDKDFTIKLTDAEVGFVIQRMAAIRKYINESNLPNLEVRSIVSSLDSINNMIVRQVNAQTENR